MIKCKRGDIWLVNLGNKKLGSEQIGIRPCVVVQNDKGNAFSPTTIVCPITSKTKPSIPTHVQITNLELDSIVLCEQIVVIDKCRLRNYITKTDMTEIDKALKASLGIGG